MLQSLFPTEIVLKEDSAQSSGAPPLVPEQNSSDNDDIKTLENKAVQKDGLDVLIELPDTPKTPPLAVLGNRTLQGCGSTSSGDFAIKGQHRKSYSVVIEVKIQSSSSFSL